MGLILNEFYFGFIGGGNATSFDREGHKYD